ncbi:MAG: UDP-3-O-[3-hydroxymyristoyl] N-acetylglucosamine deacetylase [Deltaproteobacteria bacterium]|nr:MAG: UDP-3-O-[3-hydroxymyristoyl] N-acetylglucosamine deacetylase [Deltaproteobacteria bacterium]
MGSLIEPHQYTLKRSVSCCGVGLHSGRTVNLTIKPAPANTGIRFTRTDLARKPKIQARVEQVVDTRLATTIGHKGVSISTTEHLMAALRGFGIDNADIEIDSHEVPIMDGSAGPFMALLKRSGRQRLDTLRRVIRIVEPLEFEYEGKSIRVEPYDGFKVTGRIHFEGDLLHEQRYCFDFSYDGFSREIARARTFGFVEQVEALWQNGLALGGTLDNVVAIHWDRRSILNEDGLRYSDEFIRHKVLDVIGDMTLLGAPLLGHVIADRSGHSLHLGLTQMILDSPQCWEWVRFDIRDNILRQVVTTSAGNPLQPIFSSNQEVFGGQPA